ncbi:MAG: hypothetical protein PF961_04585 [Planctomycetota bacterium]|jgi:exopolyphosphatase/guanosine-5'-triphosphate,3'-diphosphate pyrophosphatase|nr:hypothetical protein [Planctomycetota bacterium]
MSGHPVLLIDCGSSAVRAYVAEVGPGQRSCILEDLVREVDLTGGLAGGRLDRAAMDAVAQAIEDIIAVGRGYGVELIHAVGTAALREAVNSDVLVERLRAEYGVAVDVIDSGEEARLYHGALRPLLAKQNERLRGSALLMDVGSGTSVIAMIKNGRLVHAVDEHFGTERVLSNFSSLRDSGDYANAVDRITAGAVQMILTRLPRTRISNLVMAGNEMRDLHRLLRESGGGSADLGNIGVIERAAVEAWWVDMLALNAPGRAAKCGASIHDAGLLMLCASLLRHVMARTGVESALVPQLRLRDGMLADCLPGAQGPHHLGRAQLIAAARELSRRYGMNLRYAENTASLAVQIFDQTKELHHLGERQRTLLEFAAWVHDVGAFINVRSRHKHSFYLINAADIAGLSQVEKAVVAHVARYHRRSAPKSSHNEFQRLPRTTRVVISHLAAILRVAYALDVERAQRIRKVRCNLVDDRVVLEADRREIALESWSVEDKSTLFRDVYGLDVVLKPRGDD